MFDNLDRAITVIANGYTTQFRYAPDGERYLQSAYSGSATTNEYYDDKLYERVESASSPVERTYVSSEVMIVRTGASRAVRYRHLDQLGSLDAVTNEDGSEDPADAHGYDAFGKPRTRDFQSSADISTWQMQPGDNVYTTERGFTGHEHLDDLYLIHMNGRVYDYRLGRFLSVDPVISNPANSQSINPYSYIGNNPLSGIDPTGYEASSVANDCPLSCMFNNAPLGSTNELQVIGVNPGTADLKADDSGGGKTKSGADVQGSQQANSNPTDQGNPQKTAQQSTDATGLSPSMKKAFGALFGGLQVITPGGGFLPSPAPNSPDFEEGRGIVLLAGGVAEGTSAVAGGVVGTGLVVGSPIAGPGAPAVAVGGVLIDVASAGAAMDATVKGTAGAAALANAMQMRKSGGDEGGKAESPMLGERGTQVTSKTVWKGDGARIDVENPNPGQRPGQIHLQVGKEKYIYDPGTKSFRNAPKGLNSLLGRQDVQVGIAKGMRILGGAR